MKKGFTLIELLAVIVILAIIAVIAVPIVLNIINDTKESSILRSVDFYLNGVEMSIASAVLKNVEVQDDRYFIMEDGNLCIGALLNNTCTGDILKVEVSGNKPNSGYIVLENGTIKDIGVSLSDKVIIKSEKEELVFGDSLILQFTPGLYDENDNLLISWDDLTSKEYKTITYYDEYDGEGVEEFFSAILNVDEEGVLSSAYTFVEGVNYSAEYLVGKLVIDDSVTSIGEATFSDCPNLKEIIIPKSVTSIGDHAFEFCGSLTNIIIPESVTSIGSYAFPETAISSITIPEGVTIIEDMTFYGCKSLTSITIPKGVIEIKDGAFYGCTSLTEITIPDSVTSIGVYYEEYDDYYGAFDDCESLTTIYYKGNAPHAPWGAPNATIVRNF